MSSLKDLASLIMVPSLYKDGELHTVKPLADENIIVHPDATDNNDGVDGTTPSTSSNFTFSRGSNLAATRVDVNGLIEKGRENLLLQSNQFDTTWNKPNPSTITQGFEGYDGSLNAWKFTATGTGTTQLGQTHNASGMIVQSIYAKAGSNDVLKIYVGLVIEFNLTTGVASYSQSKMTDVGNGWWRCEVYKPYVTFNPFFTSTGSGDFIYLMNAQTEQGLVATDYIETGASTAQAGILEDMPRLDYSGGASCPSLLLEPQRTNLVSHSEYLDGLLDVANGSVSYNTITSPEGLNNAALYTENSSTNAHYIDSNTFTFTSGQDYVISVFAKYNGRFLTIQGSSVRMNSSYGTFNLQTGIVEEDNIGTASIENYGNGWYRCSLKVTATSTGNGVVTLLLNDSATGGRSRTYTGDGTSGLYYYGFQAEAASYPTSYIPTYGTSQTRSQEYGRTPLETYDVNEEQGVMFAEFEYLGGTDFQVLSMHNGGSLVDWLMVDSAGKLRGSVFYNGTYKVSMDSSPTTMSPNTYYKAAFRYESGNNALYLNGVKVGTNTSTFTNPPTLGYVQLGGFWQLSNTNVNCRVKQALLFNTALTDSECIALTTL